MQELGCSVPVPVQVGHGALFMGIHLLQAWHCYHVLAGGFDASSWLSLVQQQPVPRVQGSASSVELTVQQRQMIVRHVPRRQGCSAHNALRDLCGCL